MNYQSTNILMHTTLTTRGPSCCCCCCYYYYALALCTDSVAGRARRRRVLVQGIAGIGSSYFLGGVCRPAGTAGMLLRVFGISVGIGISRVFVVGSFLAVEGMGWVGSTLLTVIQEWGFVGVEIRCGK